MGNMTASLAEMSGPSMAVYPLISADISVHPRYFRCVTLLAHVVTTRQKRVVNRQSTEWLTIKVNRQ